MCVVASVFLDSSLYLFSFKVNVDGTPGKDAGSAINLAPCEMKELGWEEVLGN